MREEKMRYQHGLGAAQMRIGRHQRVAGAFCHRDEGLHVRRDRALDLRYPPLQVQAQVQRHLFVAGSPRVQPPARIAHTRHQLPLDEGVHVLVAFPV